MMDIIPIALSMQTPTLFWTDPAAERKYFKPIRLLRYLFRCFCILNFFYTTGVYIVKVLMTLRDTSFDNFSQSVYIAIGLSVISIGMVNFLICQSSFLEVLDSLRHEYCLPRSSAEKTILDYPKGISKSSNVLGKSAFLTTFLFCMSALKNPVETRPLPLGAYQLYDMSNVFVYVATFVLHSLAVIQSVSYGSFLPTCCFEIIMATTSQFRLVSYRLAGAFESKDRRRRAHLLARCVQHDMLVRNIEKKITSTFMGSIVVYKFVGLFTFCFGVFQVTRANVDIIQSISIFCYLCCSFAQLFFYCLLGQQLHESSMGLSRAIYNCDWTSFEPKERKTLRFIMSVNGQGVTMSYHGLAPLNFTTFIGVLKMSYSMYNLLLKTQKRGH